MKAWTIVGYMYQADIYCNDCIVDAVCANVLTNPDPDTGSWTQRPYTVEAQLEALAHQLGIDWQDEATYDSDTFPKVIFADSVEGPEYCGACHEMLIDYDEEE